MEERALLKGGLPFEGEKDALTRLFIPRRVFQGNRKGGGNKSDQDS